MSSNEYIFYFLLALTVLFITYLLIRFKNYINYVQIVWKLPGPKRHTIFGNILDIPSDSDRLFKTMRHWGSQFYPAYTMILHPNLSVNLIGPEDIQKIISSTKHTKKSVMYDILHIWLGTGLLTSYGAKWQQRRKLLTPAFHFHILKQFVGVFYKESKELVEDLQKATDQNATNVIPYITKFTLRSINETAMGTVLNFNDDTDRQYKNAIIDFVNTFVYRQDHPRLFLLNSFYYKFIRLGFKENKIVKVLQNFTNNIISRKIIEQNKINEKSEEDECYSKRTKRLALLDLLIDLQKEGAIDINGIREEIDTFMFEGHDTTSASLCFSLMLLSMHREIQEKIVQEVNNILPDPDVEPTINELNDLKFLECCIKESLRLYPSVPVFSRVVDEDVVLSTNDVIPKGITVNIHIYDMHRHPKLYPNPEEFNPDRFLPENSKDRHPFAYLPFSAGPRNCIGQKFAMLELKVALSAILRNYVLEPVDTPSTIRLVSVLVLRPKNGIKVKFIKRT